MRGRSCEGAEPRTNLEGERLQDVSLDGGGQQDDGRLWVVLVPVDVDALTLQQLQAAFVRKHLTTVAANDTIKHRLGLITD